jgi:type I restriction enzyme R subunit
MGAELIRRRNLPHWDMPDAAFFVTTCLEGSIPARGLLDLDACRTELRRRPRPEGISGSDWAIKQCKLLFARTDQWLDREPAVRHLADPRLARIVCDAMYFFAGQRYDLLAFVVMPSHFHWVFQPLGAWVDQLKPGKIKKTPRERIVQSINRDSSYRCNRLRGFRGPFWQHESYDHWIRDVEELERIIRYIEANPVKAGLATSPEAWPFSSAHDRKLKGLELGAPLTR